MDIAQDAFEIRTRSFLYGLLAALALFVAAGFGLLARLEGPTWAWIPAAVFAVLALALVPGVRDSRTPLFVADRHGVRLRNRDGWVGLLWSEMADIRVERRHGLEDPRVKVISRDGLTIYSTPLGFTTNVGPGEAEVELAQLRPTPAY